MAPDFVRTAGTPTRPKIRELDRVRLVESAEAEGHSIGAGAEGTVVLVHDRGAAFEVEFTMPIHAVIGIPAGKLVRI